MHLGRSLAHPLRFAPLVAWLLGAVGEFRKLALLAEADGHLRQKLQQVGVGEPGAAGARSTVQAQHTAAQRTTLQHAAAASPALHAFCVLLPSTAAGALPVRLAPAHAGPR